MLLNGGGLGYGELHLDERSRAWLLTHLPQLPDALTRGAAWITLWDGMLCGEVDAPALLALVLRAIDCESSEVNLQRFLVCAERLFWIFTNARAHADICMQVEAALRTALSSAPSRSAKAAILTSLCVVAMTPDTLGWLRALWSGEASIDGLPLGEPEQVMLAQELAVRSEKGTDYVERQLARTVTRERREALAFMQPALSPDAAERSRFLLSLSDPMRRRREPWVVDAMRWLHHPLREAESIALLEPSLSMIDEVKRTGDIFLPKRWLDATLGGHRSPEAATIVRRFIEQRPPDYPRALTRMVLASADSLFRASSALTRAE
ncbi:MAG: hypothetical protein QM736_09735 [Vicinamibacterales bacterium]